MTQTTSLSGLSVEERHLIRQSATRLHNQFSGVLNAETIERFLADSLGRLVPRANVTTWIPLLAERFTRDRLRALVRLESNATLLKPSMLFLCVHNAGRSQMAAGWARQLSDGQVDVFSGGSEPAGELNRAVVAAMSEKGIDISQEIPQPWSDEIVQAADVVITMGCGDACPVFPGRRYIDWEVSDPAGKPLEEVRLIRDDVERRVRDLLAELAVGPAG